MSEAASASSQPKSFSSENDREQAQLNAQRVRRETSPGERSLILRSQKGDIAAFNELVLLYEKAVYNFAYRLTGNYDDANDVSQDAFIRAFNAIHSFRGDSSFSTWLFRIATNVFLDERKKRKAHPQQSLDQYVTLTETSVAMDIEDKSPTPDVIASDKERTRILEAAIQKLPEYQRAMVVLYHVEQKSYEEIAEMMELPIGTVKSRLNRARVGLKDILTPDLELLEG